MFRQPKPATALRSTRLCVLAALMVVGLSSAGTLADEADRRHIYVTWPPVEPDKCIAAWLIKTYVETNAVFKFVPGGTSVTNGIPFDIPGSKYIRNQRRSASEAVINIHDIQDPKALALGQLARKLELGFWHMTFTEKEQPLADKLLELWKSKSEPEQVLRQSFQLIDEWSPD